MQVHAAQRVQFAFQYGTAEALRNLSRTAWYHHIFARTLVLNGISYQKGGGRPWVVACKILILALTLRKLSDMWATQRIHQNWAATNCKRHARKAALFRWPSDRNLSGRNSHVATSWIPDRHPNSYILRVSQNLPKFVDKKCKAGPCIGRGLTESRGMPTIGDRGCRTLVCLPGILQT